MSDLVSLIKTAAIEAVENGKPFTSMTGVVVGTSPLSIRVNQKLTLNENQLILTDAVRDYKTKISFDSSAILQVVTNWNMAETQEGSPYKLSFKEPIKHEITVYNSLKQGEEVLLLRTQGGQRFIVLDRLNARTVV